MGIQGMEIFKVEVTLGWAEFYMINIGKESYQMEGTA